MSWQRTYMPLGFATAQNDGTIERTNEAPSYSAFPLTDSPQLYDGSFAQSPPAAYDMPRRPAPDRTSSSATLLGEGNYSSSRPESLYTKYSYRKDSEPQSANQYPKEFEPLKQLLHLLGTGFLRFLMTAAIIVALWQIIWRYNALPVLNQGQKRMFNFLVTALSLALGLNLASSLKSVAVKGRWWILSWETRPLDEVEAILGSHSLMMVIKLGCTSVLKKPSLTIGCTLWLLVNLATQVFVAALSLNWTIEPAVDSSSNVPGSVMYSNMTQFYFSNGWDSQTADEITAHTYGELSLMYNWTTLTPDAPQRLPPVEPLTLYQVGKDDFFDFDTYTQYVFLDVPGDAGTTVGLFYSNRSVTVESTCTVTKEKLTFASDGTITMLNERYLQPNSTTYFATPSDDGTAKGCGPRCARVWAMENDGVIGYAHTCNVTVSSVANITRWQQQIPDSMARMAGQSIALTGYGNGKVADGVQSQHYDHNYVFGTWFDGNATSMAWLIRIYAMGAIVGADRFNPYVSDPAPGLVPNQGVRLTLDHPTFIEAILGGIGGFHFVIFILAAYLANKVVVIDDSYLAIALLMRPVVDKLQGHGSLLDSKGICKALKHPAVTYGTVDRHTLTGKIKHLEISEMSSKPVGSWKGWYD